jgi:hypothetical protein
MRSPREWYQLVELIAQHLPELRPAQQRGLAWWVYGAILAQSACQNAVSTALVTRGRWQTIRQQLREWLYDGADRADRAAPCQTQVEIQGCFAPLLRWVLAWWQGSELALAIDATLHGDRVTALVISVLYRGCAIPVAWHILPANQPGAWLPAILALLERLAPAIRPRPEARPGLREATGEGELTVLVLADRGLWSPRLWGRLRQLGWHPLVRIQAHSSFQPTGQGRQVARLLVPGPGHAWVGTGLAFTRARRQAGTLLVVWAADQEQPWVLLSDLAPSAVGVCWYGLRVWIELGFRACKGVGWQWQHTRRTDPTRVARHWLVLAVATLCTLAVGTRAEDADWLGLPPARLRRAPPPRASSPHSPRPVPRVLSVFGRGRSWLQRQLLRGPLWRRLWLAPEPWPSPPATLAIRYHGVT